MHKLMIFAAPVLGALVLTAPVHAYAQAPADPSCLAALKEVADAVEVPSPRTKDRACTIATPVKVSAIRTRGGSVALSGEPVLDCAFALELARWTREAAAPLAKRRLKRRLTSLSTGPGFQCRRRNRRRTGKLSEHSFGLAVDIVGFTLGKRSFAVRPARRMKRRDARYLKVVRRAACTRFTTILGPGSNAAHADHLHFDLGRAWRNGVRRKKPYRICN